MAEFIIYMPDDYPINEWRDVYYPDERDDPMPIREEVVRCRDCESATDHYEGMDIYWCEYLSRYVGADMFCAWGRRADA